MILGFGNNVVSSLASDITASQKNISVMPGDGPLFAALLTSDFSNKSTTIKKYAKITLADSGETAFEICHLISVSGDTLTVIRGQEGTAAKGWSLKDVISNFATRGSENVFPQIAHIQSGFYTSGIAGGTANALTLELPSTFFLNGSSEWFLKTPIVVYPSQNNTGAATLQLTLGGKVLGTFPLYKGDKAALVANDILKDVALVCLMDNNKSFFNVSNPGAIYAGLGTAAFRDVQTSTDDITPGRVLVNGGALAIRSVSASSASDNEGAHEFTDTNDLPVNSVSFVYESALNSPGFNAALLDYGGRDGKYRTELAVSYNGSQRFKFRSLNGVTQVWRDWQEVYHTGNKPSAADVNAVQAGGGEGMNAQGTNRVILGWNNKRLLAQIDNTPLGTVFNEFNPPTPEQVGAVPSSGGKVGYLEGASYYSTDPSYWPGGGAFRDQYTNKAAPFLVPVGYKTPLGQEIYLPIIKGISQTEQLGWASSVSFGILRTGGEHFGQACIHVIGDGGTSQAWTFNGHSGDFVTHGGSIVAGVGIYEGSVRVYSPNNPPPIDLPAGAPVPWPSATPPSGWTLCNGSAFNTTSYPKLAAAYPGGTLPDLRGVFIRGWDNGRGIDSGRGILTQQAGQSPISSIAAYSWPDTGIRVSAGTDNQGNYSVHQQPESEQETRPVNVAFNYIVRAA